MLACFQRSLNVTDYEPTPIERTQLIEIALNTYKSDSLNLVEINQLDHNIGEIDSKLGQDGAIKPHLIDLRNSVAALKDARKAKSQEAEKAALASASAANLRLRGAIAAKMRG
jgi:hypothetical protein